MIVDEQESRANIYGNSMQQPKLNSKKCKVQTKVNKG